eukprot:m.42146 g.42146  ORF g.42146 m.42146 type:complete len:174 (-) comp15012_c0_seq2:351-872(-)
MHLPESLPYGCCQCSDCNGPDAHGDCFYEDHKPIWRNALRQAAAAALSNITSTNIIYQQPKPRSRVGSFGTAGPHTESELEFFSAGDSDAGIGGPPLDALPDVVNALTISEGTSTPKAATPKDGSPLRPQKGSSGILPSITSRKEKKKRLRKKSKCARMLAPGVLICSLTGSF